MTFAEYTAGDEIGWGPESIVYEAEPVAGPSPKPLAMKVRGFNAASEGQALLEAGREQQRAAAAGCTAVAPILALGVEGHSYFVVTPRYSRSLLSLIESKVAVQPEGLERLAEKVLAGLRQLREKQGRAHGRITAANILVEGSTRLSEGEFFLSDFSPEKARNFAGDIHDFGKVFYHLVRRREIESFDWPIAHSTHWSALGGEGEELRTFCNSLLHPALATAPDPIASAEQALVKLRGGGGVSIPWKPIAIAAAVVGLAAGGWFFASRLKDSFSSAKPAIESQAGASEDAWFGPLAEDVSKDAAGAGGDAYLEARVWQPVRALHLSSSEIAALKKGKPASDKVKAAAHEVKAALDVWDARAAVSDGYDELAGLGWTFPAGSIARLRGDFAFDRPLLPQLQAVGHAAALLPRVRSAWQQLQPLLDQLTNSGDSFLAKVPAYVSREASGAPDLDALVARLEAQSRSLPRLLTLWSMLDRARFQAEAKVDPEAAVSESTLRDWEKQAKLFAPDPAVVEATQLRWRTKFEAARTAAAGDAPRLREIAQAHAEADASLPGLLPIDAERLDREVDAKLASLTASAPPPPMVTVAPPTTPPPPVPPPTAIPPVATVLPPIAPGDRDIYDRLLTQLRAVDLASKSVGQMRGLRDNFVEEVRRGTSPAFLKEVGPFLQAMSALPLREVTVAPPLPGWQGPVPSANGVTYTWGKHRLEFTLIPRDGEKSACYLGAQELSIVLLFDWMNEHGGNWSAVDLRASPTVRGPRGWEPRGPGIGLRRDWTWPAILGAGQTFYPPASKAPAPEPPSGLMPLNYIGFRSALAIAAQFGARLPTPEEWVRAYRLAKQKGWDGVDVNLRDARWERQRAYVASLVQAGRAAGAELRDPPWPDGDIFIPAELKGLPRGEKARIARSDDDRYLWFHPVLSGTPQPLDDLVGNVAEFAADGDGARGFVLGGSALSPPELDPATPYALSPAQRSLGFSDVGVRLALSAGGGKGIERNQEEEAFRKVLATAPAKKP